MIKILGLINEQDRFLSNFRDDQFFMFHGDEHERDTGLNIIIKRSKMEIPFTHLENCVIKSHTSEYNGIHFNAYTIDRVVNRYCVKFRFYSTDIVPLKM
jgi:hypothetical protein